MVTVDLAPKGDLVFLVGEGEDEIRVRVNSDILINTSSVFALLNANGQPTKVKLPEDDPKALLSICRVLHGRKDAVVTSATLPQVTYLADKYDRIAALSYQSDDWIRDPRSSKDSQALWQLSFSRFS
ncbi:Fc.00g071780.m01.CDS01 [Cosmosporella sp. VM-42]